MSGERSEGEILAIVVVGIAGMRVRWLLFEVWRNCLQVSDCFSDSCKCFLHASLALYPHIHDAISFDISLILIPLIRFPIFDHALPFMIGTQFSLYTLPFNSNKQGLTLYTCIKQLRIYLLALISCSRAPLRY